MTTLYQWVKENWFDPINKGEHAPNNPWLELRRQKTRLQNLEESSRRTIVHHGYSKWTYLGVGHGTAWTLNYPDHGNGHLYQRNGQVQHYHNYFCWFDFEGVAYIASNMVSAYADKDYGETRTYTTWSSGNHDTRERITRTDFIGIRKGTFCQWFKIVKGMDWSLRDGDVEIIASNGTWSNIDSYIAKNHPPFKITLRWDSTEYDRLKKEIEDEIERLEGLIPAWRESIYQLGLNLKELEDFEAFKRYVANKRVTEEQVAGKIETMDLNTIARHLFLADIEDLKAGFAEALNPQYEGSSGALTPDKPMPGCDRYFRKDYLEGPAREENRLSRFIANGTGPRPGKGAFWCLRNVHYEIHPRFDDLGTNHTYLYANELLLAPSDKIWYDYLEWLLRREVIVPERNRFTWLEDQAKAPIVFKRHPDVNDAMANAFAICGHLRKVQLALAGNEVRDTYAQNLNFSVNGRVPDTDAVNERMYDAYAMVRYDTLLLGIKANRRTVMYQAPHNPYAYRVPEERLWEGSGASAWGLALVNNGQLYSYDCKPKWNNNKGDYEVQGTVVRNDTPKPWEERFTASESLVIDGKGIFDESAWVWQGDRAKAYLYWNGLSDCPMYPDKHLKPKTGGLLLGDDEDTEELIKRFNAVLGGKGRAVRKTLPVGLGERRGTESSTGVAYQHDIDFGVRYRIRIELTDKTMDISDIYRLYLELAKFNREYLLSGFFDIRRHSGTGTRTGSDWFGIMP